MQGKIIVRNVPRNFGIRMPLGLMSCEVQIAGTCAFSPRLVKPLVICRLEVRRAFLGNFCIVFVPVAGRIYVHPIPDNPITLGRFNMDDNNLKSIDLVVSVESVDCETNIRKRKAR